MAMFRKPAVDRVMIALAATLACVAAPAAAQALRVNVADARTGAPVAGAMVRVEDEAGQLVQGGFADERGGVRLRLENPGMYTVTATRSGYQRGAGTVAVSAAGETPAAVRLEPRPVALDTVMVVTHRGEREYGSQTFVRRSSTGEGIYLDSAYVARLRARWPGELLASVPGIEIRLENGPQAFRRPYTRMGGRCLTSLVNGLPYYGGWPRWVPLEETLRRTDVVAIEVYRVYNEVPTELRRHIQRGRCGVIVYWTEDGWHSPSRGIFDASNED